MIEVPEFDTYVIGLSGGADSVATVLWCLENVSRERLRFVHNPTGASWPFISDYLLLLGHKLDILIEEAQAGDYPIPSKYAADNPWTSSKDLYNLILSRGMWPGGGLRFCTKYLKQWPIRLYTAHKCGDNSILVFGERAAESVKRSKLPMFGPDTFRELKVYKFPIWRPILQWSDDDVVAMLRRHNVPRNPVYNMADRCGCWCCPLGSVGQVTQFISQYPVLSEPWLMLEKFIDHSWKSNISLGDVYKDVWGQDYIMYYSSVDAGGV